MGLSKLRNLFTQGNNDELGSAISHSEESQPINEQPAMDDQHEGSDATLDYAIKIQNKNPELAEDLFKKVIDAGNRGLAAEKLATLYLSKGRDKEARHYYEMAYNNGRADSPDLLVNYGFTLIVDDASQAIELFEKAMALGERTCAPCNLGHMYFFEAPDRAKELYELSIENELGIEVTESYIGLARLLEQIDKSRAEDLLASVSTRENYESSLKVISELFTVINPGFSGGLKANEFNQKVPDNQFSFADPLDAADFLAGIVAESQTIEDDIYRAGLERYAFRLFQNINDLYNSLNECCEDAMNGEYGNELMQAMTNGLFVSILAFRDNPYPMFEALKERANEDPVIDAAYLQFIKNYCLVKAIAEKDVEMLRHSIYVGANPNQRCWYDANRHTPVVDAVLSGDIEICQTLIEAGADVDMPQKNSETALLLAAMRGDNVTVSMLLDAGADPNKLTHAGTALALADNLTIAIFLLGAGADPNIPDRDGDLPIIGFIDTRRYEIIYALMIGGTDVNYKNKSGETPVDRVARYDDQLLTSIVVGGNTYTAAYSGINIDPIRNEIERRIEKLLSLSYSPSHFADNKISKGLMSQEQRDALDRAATLVGDAVEAKRFGSLNEANRLYIESVATDEVFFSDHVWGWFKVLLLAKNFRDALLILRYYHAISVGNNYMEREAGELDFSHTSIRDSFLTLEFDSFKVFADATGSDPFDKFEVENKIRMFGGSEQWDSYSLSENEFDSFVRYITFGDYGLPG